MTEFLAEYKISFFIIFFITANVLWIWIKTIIKSKGYPTILFWAKKIELNPFFFIKDFYYMHKVIANESNKPAKIKYRILLYGLYADFALFVLVILWPNL